MSTNYGVQSVAEGLKNALMQYLEAQYHIWDEGLLAERRKLLEAQGIIYQVPFIEATPSYAPSKPLLELALPKAVQDILAIASSSKETGIPRTPYMHQAQALSAFFADGADLIVATGTGSGKTESFLMPILGALALEAERRGGQNTTSMHAARAILLYPMNALVNDQISRLRKLFGNDAVAEKFRKDFGRTVTFGMYTGRTPYPGKQSSQKDQVRLRQLIEALFTQIPPEMRALLKAEGKWPAKDMASFVANDFRTSPQDAEMFSRQEMYKSCPDILVTNYSMLEYMLLRPIERRIFEQTRDWLNENKQNKITIVIDEAHMYRGAAGAEVAMLLRRLQARLGVSRDRIRYILTSASLGSTEAHFEGIKRFAADFTGSQTGKPFQVITGTRDSIAGARIPTEEEARALSELNTASILEASQNLQAGIEEFRNFQKKLGRAPIATDLDVSQFRDAVFATLQDFPPAGFLVQRIVARPTNPQTVVSEMKLESELGQRALNGLVTLCTFGQRATDGKVFLPVRLHMFFRGFDGLYACVNPNCSEKQHPSEVGILGRLFESPRDSCKCGGRVLELFTHRDCGAAFLEGFYKEENGDFVLHERSASGSSSTNQLIEVEFLVEADRSREEEPIASVWLHIFTGRIVRASPGNSREFLKVLQPKLNSERTAHAFNSCPVCLRKWKRGHSKIMDLVTKGEAPFAHLLKNQVQSQPATRIASPQFPNAGRKSLIFSDGRQKAARLARDIPRETENDVFRQLIAMAAKTLVENQIEPTLAHNLYSGFLNSVSSQNVVLYDGEDRQKLLMDVDTFRKDLLDEEDLAATLRMPRTPTERYWVSLLKQIGPGFYSLTALTIAHVEPSASAKRSIRRQLPDMDAGDLDVLQYIWISGLLNRFAFNSSLSQGVRSNAGAFGTVAVARGFQPSDTKFLATIFPNLNAIEKVFQDAMALDSAGSIFLRPDRVSLCLSHDRDWIRCLACTVVSPFAVRNRCTNCGSEEVESAPADQSEYLRARKAFWRDPVVAALDGRLAPFNLTVEEHTAQLNYKDVDEPNSTTEEFERRFRDIVLASELPVDVLSSTTTMEVGIDIGSLIAVALRNVPPMRQNYQQRAGRTGRRGAAVSTVITYAQNSPHDAYYFSNPEEIIAGDPPLPSIDVRNPKIIARHINAALIHRYFHDQLADVSVSNDLFSMLGTTWNFFNHPDQDFSLLHFEEWLREPARKDDVFPQLEAWLPDEVHISIEAVAFDLIAHLKQIAPGAEERLGGDEKYFIEFLFSRGILPAYAFPRDLCALQIETSCPPTNGSTVKILERPQQSLAVALTEYAPGRLVVVNKKTYRIGTVAAATASTQADRATPLFREMRYYSTCPDCSYTQLDEADTPAPLACPTCNSQSIFKMSVIQPEVVFAEGGRQINELDDEQVLTYASSAQLPFATDSDEFEWLTPYAGVGLTSAINQKLVMVNAGPSGSTRPGGFWICDRCGKTETVPSNAESHFPDYLVETFRSGHRPARCSGVFQNVFLGYTFATDIMLMRIELGAPLRTTITDKTSRKPLEVAITSLAEALSIAAALTLDIDARELSAGHRFVSLQNGQFADLYIFDTLSGGAGYAHMAAECLGDVLARARVLLENCNCGMSCTKCLRHYGNRFKHGDLDRFLALDLLRYIESRLAPQLLGVEEQRAILSRLIGMLQMDGWSIDVTQTSPVLATKNGVRRVLWVYPALLDPRQVEMGQGDDDILISVFDLVRDFPSVFASVAQSKTSLQ